MTEILTNENERARVSLTQEKTKEQTQKASGAEIGKKES